MSDSAVPPPHGQSDASATEPLDPLQAFAELGRIRLADGDLRHVLARVAALAKAAIPAAAEVSVTLVTDQGAGTPAFTGRLAMAMDEIQYDGGEGPCLDAARNRSVVSVPDTGTGSAWPGFDAAAVAAGVGSSLSVGIPVVEPLTGALNL